MVSAMRIKNILMLLVLMIININSLICSEKIEFASKSGSASFTVDDNWKVTKPNGKTIFQHKKYELFIEIEILDSANKEQMISQADQKLNDVYSIIELDEPIESELNDIPVKLIGGIGRNNVSNKTFQFFYTMIFLPDGCVLLARCEALPEDYASCENDLTILTGSFSFLFKK